MSLILSALTSVISIISGLVIFCGVLKIALALKSDNHYERTAGAMIVTSGVVILFGVNVLTPLLKSEVPVSETPPVPVMEKVSNSVNVDSTLKVLSIVGIGLVFAAVIVVAIVFGRKAYLKRKTKLEGEIVASEVTAETIIDETITDETETDVVKTANDEILEVLLKQEVELRIICEKVSGTLSFERYYKCENKIHLDKLPGIFIPLLEIKKIFDDIYIQVSEHPEQVKILRSFSNYQVPQLLKVLETYVKLNAKKTKTCSIIKTLKEIEQVTNDSVAIFLQAYNDLFEFVKADVSSDVAVMKIIIDEDAIARHAFLSNTY